MTRKQAPTEWKVDEPYSPPYALPNSNTKPTLPTDWRIDEPPVLPTRNVSPTNIKVEGKTWTAQQFKPRTVYKQTRRKRLV